MEETKESLWQPLHRAAGGAVAPSPTPAQRAAPAWEKRNLRLNVPQISFDERRKRTRKFRPNFRPRGSWGDAQVGWGLGGSTSTLPPPHGRRPHSDTRVEFASDAISVDFLPQWVATAVIRTHTWSGLPPKDGRFGMSRRDHPANFANLSPCDAVRQISRKNARKLCQAQRARSVGAGGT